MKKIKSSGSILEQIIEDCHQVSRERVAEPQPAALTTQRVNRRRFFSQSAKGVIGAGLALGTLAQGNKLTFAQAVQPPLGEATIQDLTPVVEVIGEKVWDGDVLNGQIVGEMLSRAMIKLTGLDSVKEAWREFVLPHDIIGIKINPIGGKKLCTHRILVDTIVDQLYEAGVLRDQVIIWDRFEAHLINAGYKINLSNQGVRCLASDSDGVGYDDETFYETEKDVEVRREDGSTASRYTKILTDKVTAIINVPILKHHAITGISGCLKNLAFGSVDNTLRFHSNPLNCDPAIGDIFAHPVINDKVVLNIADGLLAAFDGGPVYDPNGVWKYGGLLVSPDPVAVDQIALETINEKRQEAGLKPAQSAKYIRSSWRLGLGTNNLDEVDYQQMKL
jgi:uncharacterized protein (DUF362 family)